MGLVEKEFPQVPSGFVDEAWHTHINFFGNYINICLLTQGKLLHHSPTTEEEENEQEEMKK